MGKRFLVTGGAGFIGSHLTQLLIGQDHQVVVLDDLSTGCQKNISHLIENNGVVFVQDTVENPLAVEPLVRDCDAVFHLASAVGVKLIVEQPVRTIRTTIHGTEVVLEAACRHKKPVLITSSSEVYGKGVNVPFGEDDDVVMGATRFSRWCYAYGKGVDEFLGLAYYKQYGLPVVLARLFNTVGPGQTGMYGMVLPRFVAAALANRPLEVYGDGNQTRCFCHVADITRALTQLMDTPSAMGQVFNLGSDQEVSINDLARRVVCLAESASQIIYGPYEQAYGSAFDDLTRRVPRLDRVRSAIGFAPRYNLDQIIESVIQEQKRGRP